MVKQSSCVVWADIKARGDVRKLGYFPNNVRRSWLVRNKTACKSNPTPGLATYQGGTVSSSSEEPEMESTISETPGERESSEQTEQPRTSRKRK